MKVASIISLLCSVSFYHCKGYGDTWFNLEEMEKQWIEEGLIEDYTPEEKEKIKTQQRESEAMQKTDEYMRYGGYDEQSSLFEIGKEQRNDRPRRPAIISAILTKDYIEENKDADKSDLTWDQTADLCDIWLYRINFVVEHVACYPMHDSSILVTAKNDWQGDDVWKFLITQTVIEELSWNGKTVYPCKREK